MTATSAVLAQGEATVSGTVAVCSGTESGETGFAVTNHNWVSVTFQNTYSTVPVVVVSPITDNDRDEGVARIRNLDTTGFDVRYEEYFSMDGSHSTETLAWIAIKNGSYTIDGNMVEVGTASVEFNPPGTTWTTVTFNNSFSATPVILTQIQSYNENDTGALGSHTRQRSPAVGSFDVKIEEETDTPHVFETVGYIAMEVDTYDTSGGWMEAGLTTDSIDDGWSGWQYYTQAFSNAPVMVAKIQTEDDTDNSAERMKQVLTNRFKIKVQETSGFDVSHLTEICGWIAADDNMLLYSDT